MNLIELRPLALDLLLGLGMVLVLVGDLFIPAARKHLLGYFTAAILAGIFAASFVLDTSGALPSGVYEGGAWVLFFKRLFLAAGFLTVLGGLELVATRTPARQGEYYVVLLMSLVGMTLLPGARDMLLLVVCFELMSIPLYVLAAHSKAEGDVATGGKRTSEAAFKFYMVGAVSTATTLFGLSLALGMAGTTDIAKIAATPNSPLLMLGMMMVMAGFGFKLGLVPFHMWVPDTYEGSSTPFVAFLSVAPKIAGITALVAVFGAGFPKQAAFWLHALAWICALTMLVGNILATPQTNAKRLLAFSGVAQMGYVLLAIVGHTQAGLGMALFYMATYVVTNIGAFLVVHAVARAGGDDSLSDFDGLARRSPWLALALLVFLLSLAGIPFVAGFWAKLYVFVAAYGAGLVELVVLGAVLAVVALFYYLQLAKAAYINESKATTPIPVSGALKLAIFICLLAVVGIGLWPAPLVEAAARAAGAF